MNNPTRFTDNHLKQYHIDGYVLIKNLFSKEETNLIFNTALNSEANLSEKPRWSYDSILETSAKGISENADFLVKSK